MYGSADDMLWNYRTKLETIPSSVRKMKALTMKVQSTRYEGGESDTDW